MGLYKHLKTAWLASDRNLTETAVWRAEGVSVRIKRPSRLDKARALGYKPISGVALVRQRVDRGGRKRPDIKGGRRSKHARQIKILDMNYQTVAEQRCSRRYPNMEVLNSYYVGKDGRHAWYEIILVDRNKPETLKNYQIAKTKGRANRGLTSAAKKSRGLRHKGKGAEKLRPSKSAAYKRKISTKNLY